MSDRLLTFASILRLSRVTTAFAAIANVWFVILWSLAASDESPPAALVETPLWLLLGAGALAAGALYAFGTALNDIFDVHRDQALRPHRPIASGAVRIETAVLSTAITLLLAILGAAAFGTVGVVLTLGLLLAILVFNATGKFIPGLGLLLLGLIYAGHMMIPNVMLRFVWPVWLVMTHALCAAGLSHVLGRKSPALTRRAIVFALAGWLIWTALLLTPNWPHARDVITDPFHHGFAGPVAVVVLLIAFGVVVVRRLRALGPGPRLADKIDRYGAIWLALYACAWLFGAGFVVQGWIMAGLAAVGILGMVILRETYNLVDKPVGYRR